MNEFEKIYEQVVNKSRSPLRRANEAEIPLPDVDDTIGTDADGTAIEQGHIVTYNGAQYVVNGPAVAGTDDEAMVDIIQLGKDITVPAKQLTVFGELGG
jgi:hypothetical protein